VRALEEVNRIAKVFPRHAVVAKELYRVKDNLLSVLICCDSENVDLGYQDNGNRHRNTLLITVFEPISGLRRAFHTAFELLSTPARVRVFNRIGAPPHSKW
jgi:hypothetical protein